MVNVTSLAERARRSEDHEAYAAAGKGPGVRIGVGARVAPHKDPIVFLEVVLDPFPVRPAVDAERLREQSERLARLQARGYETCCDTDGTITCERLVPKRDVAAELRALRELLSLEG